jgi:hypothetical protein
MSTRKRRGFYKRSIRLNLKTISRREFLYREHDIKQKEDSKIKRDSYVTGKECKRANKKIRRGGGD